MASNGGRTVHLVVARDGAGLWLLGSGPTPAFGRRYRCWLQAQLQAPVRAVIDPMARAELVLGNAGFAGVPVWAAKPVADAMRAQCPRCTQRLREQLGPSAAEFGPDPVRLPERALKAAPGADEADAGGRFGPFEWRLLDRGEPAAPQPVTVWRHRRTRVTVAHGLLRGDGPPDGRDARVQRLPALLDGLLRRAAPGERFVGDRGPPLDAAAVARQREYWRDLLHRAELAVESGAAPGEAPPTAVAGWAVDERHALNWQRAWQQAEDAWLARAPRPPPPAR